MNGGVGLTGQSPWAAWMSVWHRPLDSIRTSTSPGPGSGIGRSCICRGEWKSVTTAALMVCSCQRWRKGRLRRVTRRDAGRGAGDEVEVVPGWQGEVFGFAGGDIEQELLLVPGLV